MSSSSIIVFALAVIAIVAVHSHPAAYQNEQDIGDNRVATSSLESRGLHFKGIFKEDQKKSVDERKKKDKTSLMAGITSVVFAGWKHMLLPFLLGVMLKVTTLIPLTMMVMAIIGGLAFVTSKMALLTAFLTAVHQHLTKKVTHHVEALPPHAYPIPTLEHHHSAASEPYAAYQPAGHTAPAAHTYRRRVIHAS